MYLFYGVEPLEYESAAETASPMLPLLASHKASCLANALESARPQTAPNEFSNTSSKLLSCPPKRNCVASIANENPIPRASTAAHPSKKRQRIPTRTQEG